MTYLINVLGEFNEMIHDKNIAQLNTQLVFYKVNSSVCNGSTVVIVVVARSSNVQALSSQHKTGNSS